MSQKEAAKTEALTAEIDMIRRKDSSPSERAKGPVQRKKEQEAKAEFEIEGVKKKEKEKKKCSCCLLQVFAIQPAISVFVLIGWLEDLLVRCGVSL